jgi:hypothetical protein
MSDVASKSFNLDYLQLILTHLTVLELEYIIVQLLTNNISLGTYWDNYFTTNTKGGQL